MVTVHKKVTEAIGIFHKYDDLEEAINELETNHFGRHEISVRGSDEEVEKRFGRANVRAQSVQDDPYMPSSTDIKKEELGIGQGIIIGMSMLVGVIIAVIAQGPLIPPDATSMLAIIAISGLIGAGIGIVLAKILAKRYKKFFQDQIENGGLLIWVVTSDKMKEVEAKRILNKHGATNVHINSFTTSHSRAA